MERRKIIIDGVETNYSIDALGNVYSEFTKKYLKPCINHYGYYQVGIMIKGKQKTSIIHQLMAIAFLNHVPNGYYLVVDHINGNSLDNRLENLQLITNRENIAKQTRKTSSIYTGVAWNKGVNKWRAKIVINGKHKHLGYFTCELQASQVYQEALAKHLETPNAI